jgi:hypothetical protein
VVDFTAGVTRYLFADGAFGQSADAVNTTEIYATSTMSLGSLIPCVALWVDVSRVRGAYFETSLDLRVPVLPSYDPVVAAYVSALAGWSVGQEVNRQDPDEAAYFQDSGLTHLDFGLDVAVGRERRYVAIEVHVLAAQDGGARSGSGPSAGASWWLGVGFSDSLVLGVPSPLRPESWVSRPGSGALTSPLRPDSGSATMGRQEEWRGVTGSGSTRGQ